MGWNRKAILRVGIGNCYSHGGQGFEVIKHFVELFRRGHYQVLITALQVWIGRMWEEAWLPGVCTRYQVSLTFKVMGSSDVLGEKDILFYFNPPSARWINTNQENTLLHSNTKPNDNTCLILKRPPMPQKGFLRLVWGCESRHMWQRPSEC